MLSHLVPRIAFPRYSIQLNEIIQLMKNVKANYLKLSESERWLQFQKTGDISYITRPFDSIDEHSANWQNVSRA